MGTSNTLPNGVADPRQRCTALSSTSSHQQQREVSGRPVLEFTLTSCVKPWCRHPHPKQGPSRPPRPLTYGPRARRTHPCKSGHWKSGSIAPRSRPFFHWQPRLRPFLPSCRLIAQTRSRRPASKWSSRSRRQLQLRDQHELLHEKRT
jgi:hypothetical protein